MSSMMSLMNERVGECTHPCSGGVGRALRQQGKYRTRILHSGADTPCVGYFYLCCDQMPDEKHFREGEVCLDV